MPHITPETLHAIKERLNIVDVVRRYVELKRAGARWVAPCPFHQETKPSFSVNEEMGAFYCFGCHASGDLIEFYRRINGLDFAETVEQLAAEAGVRLEDRWEQKSSSGSEPRQRSARQVMLRMYEMAAAHFTAALQGAEGEACRAYLADRGVDTALAQRFGLGWASRDWQSLVGMLQRAGFSLDMAVEAGLLGRSERGRPYDRFRGRLIFPIRSLSNQIIAFGGRIIDQEDTAKYINSPDTPLYKKGEHLYGLAQARRGIAARGHALLTEGYMDVLTLHQYGYDQAVGVLGTALTPKQVKRLAGFTSQFRLVFDGDHAGHMAALRACEMLLTRGLSCTVIQLPDGEDIDSLLRGQGKDAFEALQARAPDGWRFCTDMLKTLSPRDAVEWARNVIRQMEIPELISPALSRLAASLHLSEAELRQGLAHERQQARSTAPAAAVPLPRQHIRDREILMYAVRYPHRLADMQEVGADLALQSPLARQLWEKLVASPSDAVFHQLTPSEKQFWTWCRGPEAPPRDNGDRELAALRHAMDTYHKTRQSSSLAAVLRTDPSDEDFAAALDYLGALQDTLGQRQP